MIEEIICSICGKKMESVEWTWGDENAHKECVLNIAEVICSKDCGYFGDGYSEICEYCDSPMRSITEEDRERWRNKLW